MLKLYHDKCSFELLQHRFKFRTNLLDLSEVQPLIDEIAELKKNPKEPRIRSFANKVNRHKIDHFMVVTNFNKEDLRYKGCQDNDFSHIMKIISAASKIKNHLDIADFKDMLKVITTKTKFDFNLDSQIMYKTVELNSDKILRVSDFDTFFLLVGLRIDIERIKIVTELSVAEIVKSSRLNGRLDTNSKLELIKSKGIKTSASVVETDLTSVKDLVDERFINYHKYLDKPKEDEDVILNTKIISYIAEKHKNFKIDISKLNLTIQVPTCVFELECL